MYFRNRVIVAQTNASVRTLTRARKSHAQFLRRPVRTLTRVQKSHAQCLRRPVRTLTRARKSHAHCLRHPCALLLCVFSHCGVWCVHVQPCSRKRRSFSLSINGCTMWRFVCAHANQLSEEGVHFCCRSMGAHCGVWCMHGPFWSSGEASIFVVDRCVHIVAFGVCTGSLSYKKSHY